ncbi:hypothetical protein [Mesorhizobium sp.]|uniref:hypothetical protein n=1 Tax=Mesorhizobium sp. TaxID=1871066 RepID=UPI000FE54928|nr:hypothetical protein [Mesorhizobium sp.]RWI72233.1 MAG: hypothetical protein EOR19_24005 [Mesorhizobium sp.]
MRSYSERRARLARMEAARAETQHHLAIVERQIEARAERMTVTSQAKSRQCRHRRSNSMWTRTDERIYQENLAAIRFERRGEFEALSRKLARQTGAIAAFRVRHRINKPEPEAVL